jgi:hypothetical protein
MRVGKSRRAGAFQGAMLAWLLVGAVVATDVPAVHDHREAGAGWYNQECLLERLAAGGPAAAP